MATKKHTFGDLADNLSNRLQYINATVRLCGFAAEARRLLVDIDEVCNNSPDISAKLDRLIVARAEWYCHEDTLPLVLKDIARQIEAVDELLNDPDVHRGFDTKATRSTWQSIKAGEV